MAFSGISELIVMVGLLSFVVSVITQVTKEIGFLAIIPTSLQVLILSLALTPIAYIGYSSYNNLPLYWYTVVASIIAGFFVAFVTMFGWEKLKDIYDRTKG